MKFIFKFEVLLKQKKRIQEEKQQLFHKAQTELDAALAKIKSMYDSIDFSRSDILKLQREGSGHSLEQIVYLEKFITGQNRRIEMARQEARVLMSAAEIAQENLVEATRELKKIEKLKEKMKLEFMITKKKRDAKRLEDIVVMRAGHREGQL